MRRGAVAGIAAGLVWLAGCGGGNGTTNGDPPPKTEWPTIAGWELSGSPGRYGKEELDRFVDEARAATAERNGFEALLAIQYRPIDWDQDPKNPDKRRIRAHIFVHNLELGAARTFQAWHGGHSISDVGEKAFADQDAVTFLRGRAVVRIVPGGGWKSGEAARPSVDIGRSIDRWLQAGK